MKRPKKLLILVLFLALAGSLLWRAKLHFVPAGAKFAAFLFASTPPKTATSPTGKKLRYRFNDAGAAHRGLHYTWCYRDHWLTGKKVVAAGYSLPEVRQGEEEFPLIWHESGRDFSVRFAAGRDDPTILWFSGTLP